MLGGVLRVPLERSSMRNMQLHLSCVLLASSSSATLLSCARLSPSCAARPDYMTTFVDKLIDWAAVAKRFEAATS